MLICWLFDQLSDYTQFDTDLLDLWHHGKLMLMRFQSVEHKYSSNDSSNGFLQHVTVLAV